VGEAESQDRPERTRQDSPKKGRPDPLLRKVLSELNRGRGSEAARLLLDVESRSPVPQETDLVEWLSARIGAKPTAKLVDAFVHLPCFYCKKGRSKCETCEGRGYLRDDMICDRCIGLGIERCDFCDGSGWVTIGDIPPDLKSPVLMRRVKIAFARIEGILRRVPSIVSGNRAPASFRNAAQLLINLDRQMGVLENAVTAAKDVTDSQPDRAKEMAKLVRACVRAAVKVWPKATALIQHMANGSRREVEGADSQSGARARAERRAELCESLAASDMLSGTSLERPFLRRAVLDHRARRSASSGRQTEAAEKDEPNAAGKHA